MIEYDIYIYIYIYIYVIMYDTYVTFQLEIMLSFDSENTAPFPLYTSLNCQHRQNLSSALSLIKLPIEMSARIYSTRHFNWKLFYDCIRPTVIDRILVIIEYVTTVHGNIFYSLQK